MRKNAWWGNAAASQSCPSTVSLPGANVRRLSLCSGRVDALLAAPPRPSTPEAPPCWVAPFKISSECDISVAPQPGGAAVFRPWEQVRPNQSVLPSDGHCGICPPPTRWNANQQPSTGAHMSVELPRCGQTLTLFCRSQLAEESLVYPVRTVAEPLTFWVFGEPKVFGNVRHPVSAKRPGIFQETATQQLSMRDACVLNRDSLDTRTDEVSLRAS